MSMRFFDETSGATLHMDRYYGFGDAGGLAGSFDGYYSLLGAMVAIKAEHPGTEISFQAKDLGRTAICVLTGQEYVDELQKVRSLVLSVFGHFVDDDGNKVKGE